MYAFIRFSVLCCFSSNRFAIEIIGELSPNPMQSNINNLRQNYFVLFCCVYIFRAQTLISSHAMKSSISPIRMDWQWFGRQLYGQWHDVWYGMVGSESSEQNSIHFSLTVMEWQRSPR